ncbi:hypothetical protein FACS189427_11630 [Planctomycetales bacterium]|nr:hypothetical protein FACS189427_11630 [Planctomycetales bacterium]
MLSRREVLRYCTVAGSAAFVGQYIPQQFTFAADDAEAALDKLGWKIGPQIYSFKSFPFDEAVKKVKACNASSFELYSGQPLTKDSQVKVGPALLKAENADSFKLFKDILAESGVKPHSMGVCPANREHFDFAAACGFNILNVEPKFDIIPEVSKLAEEYKFYIGLHNHPKPSIYWDPEIVLEHLKDASPRIGSCADTGHWLRSGLVPVDCIKKLKGHINSFHIKDLKKNEKGNYGGADVPLGQGEVGIADILKEIATQKTEHPIPFSIEFESQWDNNQPLVAEGIEFFKKTAKEIAG